MKQTITFSQFTDAFRDMGRADQFTYSALQALFDYFEQYDEDCGGDTELDVIAICCEFSEETWESIADNFSIDTSDCEDEEDGQQAVEEYLLENTTLVRSLTNGSMVYQDF